MTEDDAAKPVLYVAADQGSPEFAVWALMAESEGFGRTVSVSWLPAGAAYAVDQTAVDALVREGIEFPEAVRSVEETIASRLERRESSWPAVTLRHALRAVVV